MSDKLSNKLLELLVCPKCKGKLEYDEKRSLLICPVCHIGYPVKDGIPIMLVDDAINIREEEVK